MKKLAIVLLAFFFVLDINAQNKDDFYKYRNQKQQEMSSYRRQKKAEFEEYVQKYKTEFEKYKANCISLLEDERSFTEIVSSDDNITIPLANMAEKPKKEGIPASQEIEAINHEINVLIASKPEDVILSAKQSNDSTNVLKKKYEEVKKANEQFEKAKDLPEVVSNPSPSPVVTTKEPQKLPEIVIHTDSVPVSNQPLINPIPAGKPTKYVRISSPYGMRVHPISGVKKMHNGVDLAAPQMTPIYATASGIVTYAGSNGGYGNFIKINHENGYKTAYAHLHRINVDNQQRVKKGDLIGYVGSTGLSTGNHLHYEVLFNDKRIDPVSTF